MPKKKKFSFIDLDLKVAWQRELVENVVTGQPGEQHLMLFILVKKQMCTYWHILFPFLVPLSVSVLQINYILADVFFLC